MRIVRGGKMRRRGKSRITKLRDNFEISGIETEILDVHRTVLQSFGEQLRARAIRHVLDRGK